MKIGDTVIDRRPNGTDAEPATVAHVSKDKTMLRVD